MCYACGDPHYNTFDDIKYDFQGKCKYYLVRSESFDGIPAFDIWGTNIEFYRNPRVTITREISIDFPALGLVGTWAMSIFVTRV